MVLLNNFEFFLNKILHIIFACKKNLLQLSKNKGLITLKSFHTLLCVGCTLLRWHGHVFVQMPTSSENSQLAVSQSFIWQVFLSQVGKVIYGQIPLCWARAWPRMDDQTASHRSCKKEYRYINKIKFLGIDRNINKSSKINSYGLKWCSVFKEQNITCSYIYLLMIYLRELRVKWFFIVIVELGLEYQK